MMKVKDLITELEGLDENIELVVHGYSTLEYYPVEGVSNIGPNTYQIH